MIKSQLGRAVLVAAVAIVALGVGGCATLEETATAAVVSMQTQENHGPGETEKDSIQAEPQRPQPSPSRFGIVQAYRSHERVQSYTSAVRRIPKHAKRTKGSLLFASRSRRGAAFQEHGTPPFQKVSPPGPVA